MGKVAHCQYPGINDNNTADPLCVNGKLQFKKRDDTDSWEAVKMVTGDGALTNHVRRAEIKK
jgi:hypothetical protein